MEVGFEKAPPLLRLLAAITKVTAEVYERE